MKKILNQRRACGFTLLELLGTLAIISVAGFYIVKGLGNAGDNRNAQQMISDINTMTSAIKNKFGSADDNYTSLSTATAITFTINSGTAVKVTGTTMKNQFSGGTVAIAGDATNGQTFTITYTGVPSDACQQVVSGVGSTSFQKITAGGTTVYDAVAGVPIKPATTATACGTNTTVQMVFTAS